MSKNIDLICLATAKCSVSWPLGTVWLVEPTPIAICTLVPKILQSSDAQACLFWDIALGIPKADYVQKLLEQRVDVWHSGLSLGMGGLPGLIDFIHPIWMLNCDPPPHIQATSWRLSFRACLIRIEVLRQLGGPLPEFQTLAGAALEMGHRYIMSGVLMRHIPDLVARSKDVDPPQLPFLDELRFAYYRFGRFWAYWATLRSVLTAYAPPQAVVEAWWNLVRSEAPPETRPYTHDVPALLESLAHARVSIIIPTIGRYPYLRALLSQLREQTVKPFEIIVIDQTPIPYRDTSLSRLYADLPLKLIYLDQPGQCSSRNEGLQRAEGDYLLFLDDDDEVPTTLIADHLQNLHRFQADVSCGVADEVGAGVLPKAFTYIRTSDVFPTNNTLIHSSVLQQSGLFDLAYERGQRADGDLGMRVYLSGALMVLCPGISILHHHAPAGGLRTHRTRIITYASSRKSIVQRHLPSASEIYLALRYFRLQQIREMLWMRTFETFSLHGHVYRKIIKFIISFLLLPHTIWIIQQKSRQAKNMLYEFPQIPTLDAIEKSKV